MPSIAATKQKWKKARHAEKQFAVALRKVAKRCEDLAKKTFKQNEPLSSSARLKRALELYAVDLQKWAKATAERMVMDVARRDEAFWAEQSKTMAKNLRAEIKKTPIGLKVRERTNEAAAYITSLPLEAAQRVEKISLQYLTQGKRASVLATDILNTGQVTKSRANLIARTETARTASVLQQTRAEAVGSEGYIWRTSEDVDVRERHRKLNGKYFTWISPPVSGENGERSHPGEIYNCRCWAEVVLPGEKKSSHSQFKAV